MTGSHEVAGSSPASSILWKAAPGGAAFVVLRPYGLVVDSVNVSVLL